MSRTITVEHNGSTYYGEVMTVESTHLGSEDHGILTAYLHLNGDGTGVGVGGYGLDKPVKVDGRFSHREPTAYGFDHVMQLVRVVGASRWEDLPGRQVIVLFEKPGSWGQVAAGLAHITDAKRVLILKEHVEEWQSAHPADFDEVSA